MTVDVEDIDATIAAVKAAGGNQVGEKNEIPGVGRMAYLADPSGIVFGAMQDTSGST